MHRPTTTDSMYAPAGEACLTSVRSHTAHGIWSVDRSRSESIQTQHVAARHEFATDNRFNR